MWIRHKHPKTLRALSLRTISAQIHMVAALATLPLGWLLIVEAARSGMGAAALITLYCATGTLVFASSAIYHFLSDGFHIHDSIEWWLNRIDHWSIYCVIAASYTAFVPKVLPPQRATYLLIVVWTLAIAGSLYTYFKHSLHRILAGRAISTLIFVGFGAAGLYEAPALLKTLSNQQLALLFGGGFAYIGGAVVYYFEKYRKQPRPFDFHEVWHLAVVAGHFCHYFLFRSLYVSA